jgi:hypothetical protein
MNRQFISRFLEGRVVGIGSFLATLAASWALAGVAFAAGPTSATAPVISGTPQVGMTLTVSNGTWTPPDPGGAMAYTYTYVWKSGATVVGSSQTYTVQPTDISEDITVTVTANDGTGTGAAPPVSAGVVPAPPPNPAPTIAGTLQQGQKLTASPGVWSGSPTFHYKWTSGGGAVGTDSQTYVLAPTDVGKTIAVTVTAAYSAASYSAVPVSVGPVLPLPPAPLTLPTITGTPQQGQMLTLTQGKWANGPVLTDVWEDCTAPTACVAIPGAAGLTYTVGAGDVGRTIEVVEIASNAAPPPSNVVGATSARTATVSATSATSVVAYSQNSPSTNQPVTLVATVTSGSSNANPHGSLSFFNGSNTVSGCANKSVSGGQTVTIVCQASFGAGAAQISAAYVADPTSLVAGSTSDTTSVDVGAGSTSLSLAVTPKVAPGGRATYVATLGVPLSNAGPILPSGSIQFLDGGQPIGACGSQALSSLTATCSVRYSSAGLHSITARYDGDSNFTGSTSPASGVQVVKGAPKAPAVRAALGSTLGWAIHYSRHYSWVGELTAFAVPKGTTILVQCLGTGCPFATLRLTHVAGTVNLQRHFHHRHLRAGARITVRFTRKNWIGKSYSFRIRAGHKPKITTVCLAPNKVQHTVACPSTS